jgi:hypothetical protein
MGAAGRTDPMQRAASRVLVMVLQVVSERLAWPDDETLNALRPSAMKIHWSFL